MALGYELRARGGTDDDTRRRISDYYDTVQVLYTHAWSRTGVHYGLWDGATLSHSTAIRNMDRFVADRLELEPGRRVLDAGCGVGGTSVFLAEAYGLEVVGITLSTDQVWRAKTLAAASKARIAPTFRVDDYLCTSYPDGFFDGIVAIESVCHAVDKRPFMMEAFRILAPGGRLVVADGFLAAPLSGRNRQRYQTMLDGMALTKLASLEDFAADLRATGFVSVHCDEVQSAIQRSSRRIFALSLAGIAVCAAPCRAKIFPDSWMRHAWAGVSQRALFRSGAIRYAIFSARKGN